MTSSTASQDLAQPSGLAQTAFRTLQDTFAARDHRPDASHLAALLRILETMEQMADGTAQPSIFLASLDPGTGKSSSVVEFGKALTASAEHRNVGMLVCVGRLAEVRALMGELADAGVGSRCAVQTSDKATNDLSSCPAQEAQVLIVTQQAAEAATRRQPFKAVSRFHYQGAPRAVRVWDEAWLPGAPITLDRADLGGLFTVAQRLSGRLWTALEDFFFELRSLPDGALVDVPDWTAVSGIRELDLLSMLEFGRSATADQQRLTASALFFIAGRRIRVRRETYAADGDGRVIISYRDTLPEDVAPMVVLDASIRVRQTYADAVAHRGVVLLSEAVKDYSALTVHVWKTAGSKTAFKNNGSELIAGMAATIMSKPAERWLVVTHKPGQKVGDIEARLRRELPPGVAANVSIISWGSHLATNEFRDVGNVILGGTLFMPTCHYLALTHLAKGRPAEVHGFAGSEEVLRTTHGEHRNLVLQAACRGRVRQSNGRHCAPMDLYIIAAAASAIPTTSTIHIIFPGAQITRWCPVPPKLAGKALDAAVILTVNRPGFAGDHSS